MLSDLFLQELDRLDQVPPSIEALGRELAKQLKETQQTLASIAAMYVNAAHELADLKARQSR